MKYKKKGEIEFKGIKINKNKDKMMVREKFKNKKNVMIEGKYVKVKEERKKKVEEMIVKKKEIMKEKRGN